MQFSIFNLQFQVILSHTWKSVALFWIARTVAVRLKSTPLYSKCITHPFEMCLIVIEIWICLIWCDLLCNAHKLCTIEIDASILYKKDAKYEWRASDVSVCLGETCEEYRSNKWNKHKLEIQRDGHGDVAKKEEERVVVTTISYLYQHYFCILYRFFVAIPKSTVFVGIFP